MAKRTFIKKFIPYVWLFFSIHLLFIVYAVLKGYSYPKTFDFIRKHYEKIDFGRSFSPEIDLVILFSVLGVYLICFQGKALASLSFKPLSGFRSWIFICAFFLLIYLSEYLRQPLFYSLQISIPSFSLSEYMAFALTVVIIAPLSEELIFRGPLLFLLRGRRRYLFLIISTFWFVLIHDDLIFGTLFSFGLSFLTLRFKNLSVPIVAHAIWNFYVMHN